MAPEPEVLKRKRSKPSDWWAAAPSPVATPPVDRQPPPRNRDHNSNAERNGGIADKPTAGNRGKSVKGKERVVDAPDEENVDELEGESVEKTKPLRRGRSSGGEKELNVVDIMMAKAIDKGSKRKQGAASGQRVRKDVVAVVDRQPQKKRGPTATVQREEENAINALAEGQVAPKERGRPVPKQFEEDGQTGMNKSARSTASKPKAVTVDAPVKDSVPLRKGRSSNTEAELRAAVNYKETKSRKPGPSTNAEPEVQAGAEATSNPELAVRRGRSSNTEAELQAAVNYKGIKTVKRGQPSNKEAEPRALLASSSHDQANGKKSGQRPAIENGVEPNQSTADQNRPKKRTARQSDGNGDVQVASKLSKDRASSKKSVKPVIQEKLGAGNGSSAVRNAEIPKKSGRQSGPNVPEGASNPPARTSRNRLQRPSQGELEGRKRKEVRNARSQSPKRRRIEKPVQEDRPENLPSYQHLAAATRRVSRNIIAAKWDSLPPPCVERISQLLQDIQRPVVARLNDERRRNQASTALQMISRRLVGKISKGLPFPQGTRNHREDDFDFEKILDHNRALESQLTPAIHTNELLEAELAKEMALLESEKANLAKLETNAKAESSKRKRDGRKLHLLLQPDGTSGGEDLETDIGFRGDDTSKLVNLNLRDDQNLQSVVKNLQGHVDSIESNMRQVEGISEAMAKSKAAVQATLFEHFDSAQYQEVVLR